jgi:dimethylargininase
MGKSIRYGIALSPKLGEPDYCKALEQHENFVHALEKCGLQVIVLHAIEEYPDSCFIEDTAIITEKCIIIANHGVSSRSKETVTIKDAQKDIFPSHPFEMIKPYGTL